MLDNIAMYLGYGVMIVSAIAAAFVVIDFDYSSGHHWVFKVFGFGVVNISNSNTILLTKIRELRKSKTAGFSTRNSTSFVNAPSWFNQYVWNIGGVKA